MNYVLVTLNKDRTLDGTLEIRNGATHRVLDEARAYGKAENAAAAKAANPARNPTKRNGDTPAGAYIGTYRSWWRPATPADVRSYGAYKIDLDPVQSIAEAGANAPLSAQLTECVGHYGISLSTSQAARAERNGRSGLLCHAGALAASGKMRPTNGCIRTVEEELLPLLSKLKGPMPWIVIEVDG